MQEGLINTYKESGFFPEWASPGHRGCMVGNNSASVLVDAYMKGVKVDDIKRCMKDCCMEQRMYILKYLQQDAWDMNIITSWDMYHTM